MKSSSCTARAEGGWKEEREETSEEARVGEDAGGDGERWVYGWETRT